MININVLKQYFALFSHIDTDEDNINDCGFEEITQEILDDILLVNINEHNIKQILHIVDFYQYNKIDKIIRNIQVKILFEKFDLNTKMCSNKLYNDIINTDCLKNKVCICIDNRDINNKSWDNSLFQNYICYEIMLQKYSWLNKFRGDITLVFKHLNNSIDESIKINEKCNFLYQTDIIKYAFNEAKDIKLINYLYDKFNNNTNFIINDNLWKNNTDMYSIKTMHTMHKLNLKYTYKSSMYNKNIWTNHDDIRKLIKISLDMRIYINRDIYDKIINSLLIKHNLKKTNINETINLINYLITNIDVNWLTVKTYSKYLDLLLQNNQNINIFLPKINNKLSHISVLKVIMKNKENKNLIFDIDIFLNYCISHNYTEGIEYALELNAKISAESLSKVKSKCIEDLLLEKLKIDKNKYKRIF